MVSGCPDVSNSEPKAVPAMEHGVREEDIARGVDAFEYGAINVVRALVAEAHGGKWRGSHTLEARVGVDLARKLLGPADVAADDFGDALAAVVAQHKPQLQRAESAAE